MLSVCTFTVCTPLLVSCIAHSIAYKFGVAGWLGTGLKLWLHIDAVRPSVSIQDSRMYTKIYKKYLADRGQDEESPVGDDAGDNDDDSFGYDVKKQRTALA